MPQPIPTVIPEVTLHEVMQRLRAGALMSQICRDVHIGDEKLKRALDELFGGEYAAIMAQRAQERGRRLGTRVYGREK